MNLWQAEQSYFPRRWSCIPGHSKAKAGIKVGGGSLKAPGSLNELGLIANDQKMSYDVLLIGWE